MSGCENPTGSLPVARLNSKLRDGLMCFGRSADRLIVILITIEIELLKGRYLTNGCTDLIKRVDTFVTCFDKC